MSTELDEKLKAFLDDAHAAKSQGITLAAVYEATRKLADAQSVHEAKCDLRWDKNADHHASTGSRLTTIEAKVEGLTKSEEITGNHNLQAIATAAEAKGLALGLGTKKADSLPPIARWVTKLGIKLGEKWAYHVVLVFFGGAVVWLAHFLHFLK